MQDDESGLVYVRARFYEPGTGRFISEDSVRTGVNFLPYCKNDPVNENDESGQAEQWLGWAAVITAVGFLLKKCLELSIRYLTPSLMTLGLIAYVVDATSHWGTAAQTALGFGAIAADGLLAKPLDAAGQLLNRLAMQAGIQAGNVQWSMFTAAASNVAVYFMAIAVYTLLIGADA